MPRPQHLAAFSALAKAFMGGRKPGQAGVLTLLRVVPRMVSAGFSGRYPYLDRSRVGVALLGLVYVISPVDLIPELILPILGLGDDALVAAFSAGALLSEAQAFLDWEQSRVGGEPPVGPEHGERIVVGQVID
jgi:uncharacterized membrane protein YkvA (DUF1232 family)